MHRFFLNAGRLFAATAALVLMVGCSHILYSSYSEKPQIIRAIPVVDGRVYAFLGANGEIGTGNLGRIGNAGFIIGEHGVLVVDSGVSDAHGQALLQAIKRVTDKPVRALLVTHAVQEFLFGATAFQREDVSLWMHERAEYLMRQRCNNCLKQLNATLGEAAMRGSRLPVPEHVITDVKASEQQISALIGRRISLHYYGHSSGPGDIVVMDEASRVMFTGAMAESTRLPDTHDAKLNEWLKALSQLKALKPEQVVPGHGAVTRGAQAIDATRAYLEALDRHVARLVHQGVSLTEASAQVPMREYERWDQYAAIHGPNVHRSYLEHERRLFDGATKD